MPTNTTKVAGAASEGALSARPATLVDNSATEEESWLAPRLSRKALYRIAGRFLIMVVSVLVSAMAVELFIRWFVPVQHVGPSFATYDPTLLRMLKKNLRCFRYNAEFTMRVSVNSHGFRGPELPPAPRDCVLFLGDSQTMGIGVSNDEEYPSLIRKTLEVRYGPDRFAVINTAIGGMGNGRWIKMLRGDVWGYHPRLVVLQFSSTDFGENPKEDLFKLSSSDELIELPMPPAGIGFYLDQAANAIPGLGYSYTIALVKQAMNRNNVMTFVPDPSAPRGDSKLTYKLVEESIAICRRRGWPVLVLATDHRRETLAETERMCARLQVPLIATPNKWERPDLFFAIDPHWNVKGQRYVADLVEARMAADGILLGSGEQAANMERKTIITSRTHRESH